MRTAAAIGFGFVFVLCGCAGKIKNKPADMPSSPEEAEQMLQDNSPDKAPPDNPEASAPEPEAGE